ncbi:MAG: hypothetical protein M3177_08795, partial [Pseudomonadota bacterium]|nr:hypothetical protein [Pseudomonadota bacterium]
MKRLLAAAATLALLGCAGKEQEGYTFLVDPGYRAELIGGSDGGFTAPDGLLWHDGGLLLADEGGSAIRYWRPGEAVRTLAGPGEGLASPEDLIRDAGGNVY